MREEYEVERKIAAVPDHTVIRCSSRCRPVAHLPGEWVRVREIPKGERARRWHGRLDCRDCKKVWEIRQVSASADDRALGGMHEVEMPNGGGVLRVPYDELRLGYCREQDYRRKTMELALLRKGAA